MSNKNKRKNGIVYSTNPDFEYHSSAEKEEQTLPPQQQQIRVTLDKKQRGGKAVTLVYGFIGTKDDLNDLGKELKRLCGTGGAVKNGEILIQGDFRTRVIEHLTKKGFKAKQSGG